MCGGTPSEAEAASSTTSECPTTQSDARPSTESAVSREKMKVETKGMSRKFARLWESRRLKTYRQNHSGKNPPLNKSRDGGFQWKFW